MIGSEIYQITLANKYKKEDLKKKKLILNFGLTFLVEIHLYDVLKVLLEVGVDFFSFKPCI